MSIFFQLEGSLSKIVIYLGFSPVLPSLIEVFFSIMSSISTSNREYLNEIEVQRIEDLATVFMEKAKGLCNKIIYYALETTAQNLF